VSDRESVLASAAATKHDLGVTDVLVNNAGLALLGPSLDFPEDEWRRSLDVMTTGVFFCCQALGRQMVEKGGGAVGNISSMNATVAFPGRLAYNAAKAAVKSMTEVLAIEWAAHGIRVNAVAPGVTRTALVERAIERGHVDEDAYIRLAATTRRLGQGLRDAAAGAGVSVQVVSTTGLVTTFFSSQPVHDYAGACACDLESYGAWCRALLERGVYPPPSQFEAWFPSLAHSDEQVDRTLEAAAAAFAEVA